MAPLGQRPTDQHRSAVANRRPLTFRPATGVDVDEVVALVEAAYRSDPGPGGWTSELTLIDGRRTDAHEVHEVLATPGAQMLLAYEDDGGGAGAEAVACCQLVHQPDGSGYFGMFAVRPGRHGGGIGGQVMTEAERIATEEWGSRVMSLSVLNPRTELIAWYERRGYVRTGAIQPWPLDDPRFGRPKVDGLHFVVLEKELPGDDA